MMDPMMEKFQTAEIALSREFGDFRFFALFSREDVPGKWDLVTSAPWGDKDGNAAMKLLIDHLKASLSDAEVEKIARVIWLAPDDPGLGEVFSRLASAIRVANHSMVMIGDSVINGVAIEQAVLFACDDTI